MACWAGAPAPYGEGGADYFGKGVGQGAHGFCAAFCNISRRSSTGNGAGTGPW